MWHATYSRGHGISNRIIYSPFVNRFPTQRFLVVYNTDRTEVYLQDCPAKQTLFQSPPVHGESLKILQKPLQNDFTRV